jgi:hypothetical protein
MDNKVCEVKNTAEVKPKYCYSMVQGPTESASRPLVDFGVLNDNLIKWLVSFVKCINRF